MDVFEIDLDQGDLVVVWKVIHNGDQIDSGFEFTQAAALERAQQVIDARAVQLRWAA